MLIKSPTDVVKTFFGCCFAAPQKVLLRFALKPKPRELLKVLLCNTFKSSLVVRLICNCCNKTRCASFINHEPSLKASKNSPYTKPNLIEFNISVVSSRGAKLPSTEVTLLVP